MNCFFIKPVDKTGIQNIILPLNPLKAVGPNSSPTKILKLLSNYISYQLSDRFNLSFSLGVLPSILKSSKVILIFKEFLKELCIIVCVNFYFWFAI